MTSNYEFDISRAAVALDVFVLREDIQADDALTGEEKAALLKVVSEKISALSQARQGKPRW